ncbi:hypothetical protein [Rugamonas sp.]|uniref:hypothetical protein n=1 Tax=Rugamonas sp. TaxID=1926287 RepID=UPI0025EAC037|nr:hypothetical protein [Rugamonas sp.]
MAFIERRSRPQRTMAMMVEIGIELVASQGRYTAAQFLEDAGVPLPVICRVMDEQGRRRVQAAAPPDARRQDLQP